MCDFIRPIHKKLIKKLINKIDSLNIIIDSLSLKRTNIDKKIDTIFISKLHLFYLNFIFIMHFQSLLEQLVFYEKQHLLIKQYYFLI